MKKELIEEEIEKQETKLSLVLGSTMKEPERSNNIIRITRTILLLKEFMEKYS